MKKSLFIIIILLISQVGFAQTFGGGIFGGLSASQLDGDRSSGYHKAGLSFGIYTNAKINKYIDAQMELKYIQKGSKWENEDQSVFYQSKLNYIELPVFLKYSFLDKFSANIGLAVGYLQKSTENKDRIGDEPADPPFNEFEFSGLAGVEYEIIEIKLNEQGQSFRVEIEMENRKRETFSFPVNDGWEVKEENGKEKFINEITKVLSEREEKKKNPIALNFEDFKNKKIK